jgi:NAD(P)-dependent dehydrogenase (short-subunit alcohol dehydrogenase family)
VDTVHGNVLWTSEDITDATARLISEEARPITGQDLSVDGRSGPRR